MQTDGKRKRENGRKEADVTVDGQVLTERRFCSNQDFRKGFCLFILKNIVLLI